MENQTTKKDIRAEIIETFAQWIAFSGTRSGCPLKSRDDIYPLIKTPDYSEILRGDQPITKEEFNVWHEKSSQEICERSSRVIDGEESKLPTGWATKLINLYLKELVYVGQYGRPDLIRFIHPPIDNGLWDGIKKKFGNNESITNKTHSKTKIKDIVNYQDYQTIISGIEMISQKENCLLIEVEQFWEGTKHKI